MHQFEKNFNQLCKTLNLPFHVIQNGDSIVFDLGNGNQYETNIDGKTPDDYESCLTGLTVLRQHYPNIMKGIMELRHDSVVSQFTLELFPTRFSMWLTEDIGHILIHSQHSRLSQSRIDGIEIETIQYYDIEEMFMTHYEEFPEQLASFVQKQKLIPLEEDEYLTNVTPSPDSDPTPEFAEYFQSEINHIFDRFGYIAQGLSDLGIEAEVSVRPVADDKIDLFMSSLLDEHAAIAINRDITTNFEFVTHAITDFEHIQSDLETMAELIKDKTKELKSPNIY